MIFSLVPLLLHLTRLECKCQGTVSVVSKSEARSWTVPLKTGFVSYPMCGLTKILNVLSGRQFHLDLGLPNPVEI